MLGYPRRMGRKHELPPIALEVLQDEYPELATSAELQRVRVLDL